MRTASTILTAPAMLTSHPSAQGIVTATVDRPGITCMRVSKLPISRLMRLCQIRLYMPRVTIERTTTMTVDRHLPTGPSDGIIPLPPVSVDATPVTDTSVSVVEGSSPVGGGSVSETSLGAPVSAGADAGHDQDLVGGSTTSGAAMPSAASGAVRVATAGKVSGRDAVSVIPCSSCTARLGRCRVLLVGRRRSGYWIRTSGLAVNSRLLYR